ncbi:hypothetical protein [Megasphaera sp. DISK 18]|uniref:hypothetical protein n=1 Tax=Megasphaera sp. DISK 18 TaxID=1776081 RepID=UPI000806FD46|nr:hypothetical protein [Megasphaera sp. DISK 18]OBZ32487.1 hypothetical protein A0U42_10290 [Megasphaera sp. DISK 18]
MEHINLLIASQNGWGSFLRIAVTGIAMVVFLLGLGKKILRDKKVNYKERIFKLSSYLFLLVGSLIMYCSMLEIIQSIFILLFGGAFFGIGMILLGYGIKYENKELIKINDVKHKSSYKPFFIFGGIIVILMCMFMVVFWIKQNAVVL